MKEWLKLCGEVWATDAVQILFSSDRNDPYALHFTTDRCFFPECAIISDVEQGNWCNVEDEISYATRFKEAFLEYVEDKYFAIH